MRASEPGSKARKRSGPVQSADNAQPGRVSELPQAGARRPCARVWFSEHGSRLPLGISPRDGFLLASQTYRPGRGGQQRGLVSRCHKPRGPELGESLPTRPESDCPARPGPWFSPRASRETAGATWPFSPGLPHPRRLPASLLPGCPVGLPGPSKACRPLLPLRGSPRRRLSDDQHSVLTLGAGRGTRACQRVALTPGRRSLLSTPHQPRSLAGVRAGEAASPTIPSPVKGPGQLSAPPLELAGRAAGDGGRGLTCGGGCQGATRGLPGAVTGSSPPEEQ